jgi:hypothetical protein
MNPNITMEFIEKHPEKPWDWESISDNPNITMEIIEAHPEEHWDWVSISMNPNITMDIIEKYPEKPWDWLGISKNPNLTTEFIEKHIHNIDFKHLSLNKFTFENSRNKKREGYLLLERERSFHKLQNLYIITQYL